MVSKGERTVCCFAVLIINKMGKSFMGVSRALGRCLATKEEVVFVVVCGVHHALD